MALIDAQSHYDPAGGELAGYITPQDAKNSIAQIYADLVAAAGDTMTGELILFGDPTVALGAATKQYVDNNGGVGGDNPAMIVAAVDSSAAWKAAATPTYTCDGTADDVQINAAIDAAAATAGTSSSSGGSECYVLLAPGTYTTNAPIDIHGRVALRGASRGGVVITPSASHSAIGSATSGVITLSDPVGVPYDHQEVSQLSIHGASRDLNGIYSNYQQSAAEKDDDNLGGQPDHGNILRDLTIVSCGRSGVYITFVQASTSWRMDHIRVFGCGDTLNTSAGIYFNGLDGWITNCDVGSQGVDPSTTNVGFQIAGSDSSVIGCIAWLTKGTGFKVTGANIKFNACEAHHSDADGFEITNNRNTFGNCIAYNNQLAGFRVSANSTVLTGCLSYFYDDSYDMWQEYGVYLTQTNPSGHNIDVTTYGYHATGPVTLIPIAGATTDAALKARKPNHYKVLHTGNNPDGSAGTVQQYEWKFGCYYGYGTATPEASVTAPIGSEYTDYTNGKKWLKGSGTGNTGWIDLTL